MEVDDVDDPGDPIPSPTTSSSVPLLSGPLSSAPLSSSAMPSPQLRGEKEKKSKGVKLHCPYCNSVRSNRANLKTHKKTIKCRTPIQCPSAHEHQWIYKVFESFSDALEYVKKMEFDQRYLKYFSNSLFFFTTTLKLLDT